MLRLRKALFPPWQKNARDQLLFTNQTKDEAWATEICHWGMETKLSMTKETK